MSAQNHAPETEEVVAAARRQRAALALSFPPIERVAAALAETCRQLGSVEHPRGRATVAAIAARWGWLESSLPLHLVCAPWTELDQVRAFARTLQPRRELIGFVMPANLPGAGLHELAAALLAGCAVIAKTAAAEPIFFGEFARALAALEPALGARIAVFNWRRDRGDLTAAMSAHCDR
ncbi:MAG: acyl-CoA reductase, partial [Candidatus Binataceae bacterium]